MQEHRVLGIHNETMYCGSASNHSKKVNGSVTTAAIGKNREQKEIICPILESSGHNQPFYDDIDNSVCNNIQSQ